MKCEISIKNEYISVNGSYGGSQHYFENSESLFDKGKVKGGCGVVALADTLSYLRHDTVFDSINNYKLYFNYICRKMLFVPTRFGMTFLHILLSARHLIKKYHLPYKCFWGFSRKALYRRIDNMLSMDIPVILCIPRLFGRNKEERSISFYDPVSLLKTNQTHGHFVVITGIYSDEHDVYWSVSSWGKRYLINCNEFLNFIKKTPASLLGFILCIKHK